MTSTGRHCSSHSTRTTTQTQTTRTSPLPCQGQHTDISPPTHRTNKIHIPPEIHISQVHIQPTDTLIPLETLPRFIPKTIKLNILDGTTLQGDSGANCSATKLKEILWDYRTLPKPIPITTYNKDKTETLDIFQAIGTGIIKVINNNQDIMHFIALHTPLSTGTIY
jgi:hypothetical protein